MFRSGRSQPVSECSNCKYIRRIGSITITPCARDPTTGGSFCACVRLDPAKRGSFTIVRLELASIILQIVFGPLAARVRRHASIKWFVVSETPFYIICICGAASSLLYCLGWWQYLHASAQLSVFVPKAAAKTRVALSCAASTSGRKQPVHYPIIGLRRASLPISAGFA